VTHIDPIEVRNVYRKNDWPHVLGAYLDQVHRPGTDDHKRALDSRIEVARAIWAEPVRTKDDVVLRLAIAIHVNEDAGGGGSTGAYPDCVLGDPDAGIEEQALAHVIRGILDLAGLKFDVEGRLLG
jgi:hypothetical protein